MRRTRRTRELRGLGRHRRAGASDLEANGSDCEHQAGQREYLTAAAENTIYLAMALILLHRLAQTPT